MAAFPSEKILLGQAGPRSEMGPAEMRDLGGFPPGETIAAFEGLEDPGVHGKGFEFAGAEQQDAVGDFFADAGQFEQARLGGGVGQVLGLIQPAGALGDVVGRSMNIFGAETEEAGAQVLFGNGREFGPGRQTVMKR